MVNFHSYLSDQRIVAQVCKEVSKYIFCPPNRPMPEHVRHLLRLLPPRHLWANLSYDQRHDKDVRKVTIRRLRHIITRHLDHHSSYAYMPRLQAFMDTLRSIAQEPNSYSFPKPVVKAKIKKQKGNLVICRPTCAYHDLTAKMLTALMASYLKSWLDPMLHETNMAYRAPREWSGTDNVVTSNVHAVDLLLRWRAQHDEQTIYIAECDICKFFDTIDHDDVIDALRQMMARSRIEDAHFANLFANFVRSFDFQQDVMSCNDNPEYWRSQFGEEANNHTYCFEWIDNPPQQPIGIPQGVALSPLIANMLLNIIDEQTLGERMVNGHVEDDQLLYVRYCDDILIAHTSLHDCSQILDAYCNALEQHQLRYHPLQSVAAMKDGRNLKRDAKNHYLFWDAKSKRPYRWGSGLGNSAQWIGFLGYEISREGQIRIRKSSIAGQAEKIIKQALRIRFCMKYRQSMITQFKQRAIGGSKIDALSNIIDQAPFNLQRAKLEKLKARKLRRLLTSNFQSSNT